MAKEDTASISGPALFEGARKLSLIAGAEINNNYGLPIPSKNINISADEK